jgi:hypothetical protein
MAARAKLIESETDNRMALITIDQVVTVINGLNNADKKLIITDILNNDGNARTVLSAQLRKLIKAQVAIEVDGYIAAGNIPVSFLDKIIN